MSKVAIAELSRSGSLVPAPKQAAVRPGSMVIALPVPFADHADRATLDRCRRQVEPIQKAVAVGSIRIRFRDRGRGRGRSQDPILSPQPYQ